MSTKTISITEEAYTILHSRKESTESFSQIIVKLAGKKELASFYGVLGKERADLLEKAIFQEREQHQILHHQRVSRR
ncbi:MAG: antitoxin VapB family protein [Nanoarchaeota archaeon]|nr:antitoxin VapB family protein [Nanoarchaeota archaeon]